MGNIVMPDESDWIRRLKEICDSLGGDPEGDWMNQWRALNRVIEEASFVRPEIKNWAPQALETFGDDVLPSVRVRQLAEEAIRRLSEKPEG